MSYVEYENRWVDTKIIDRKRNVTLYDIDEFIATTQFTQHDKDNFYISAWTYLPVYGEEEWKSYEFVRYHLKIDGASCSFNKMSTLNRLPHLTPAQMRNVLKNARNIHTNDLIVRRTNFEDENSVGMIENDSYVRNIGFLAIGIFNGNEECLRLFNDVSEQCTGGEGCEAYIQLQTALTYAGYERIERSDPPGKRRSHIYLLRKK